MPSCKYCNTTPFIGYCPSYLKHVETCKASYEKGIERFKAEKDQLQARLECINDEVSGLKQRLADAKSSTGDRTTNAELVKIAELLLQSNESLKRTQSSMTNLITKNFENLEEVIKRGADDIKESVDNGVSKLSEENRGIALMIAESHKRTIDAIQGSALAIVNDRGEQRALSGSVPLYLGYAEPIDYMRRAAEISDTSIINGNYIRKFMDWVLSGGDILKVISDPNDSSYELTAQFVTHLVEHIRERMLKLGAEDTAIDIIESYLFKIAPKVERPRKRARFAIESK